MLTEGETYSGNLNNRTVTNTYDKINRLLVEAVAMGGSTTSTAYAYDKANNRASKIITGGTNAGTTAYTYNTLNQLTGYNDGTQAVSLTYDANGNRATRVVGSGTDVYSYDVENRLVTLVKAVPGSEITTGTYHYAYDYRTRRVLRDESSAGGASTRVIFSGGTSVEELDNGNTAPTVDYIRGSDYGGGVGGVLYTLRGGNPSYTHENRRGDVVAKTDSSGSLTYQAQYEAFGRRPVESGTTQDRQKANTKDEDPTGLKLEGYRYTDEDIGRFLTQDPAGYTLMMPTDKWYLDGKEVNFQEYYEGVYPGTFRDTSPAKSAKTTQAEKEDHVGANTDGNQEPGQRSHCHVTVPGQPNLYIYCKENPWTLFDPEVLDPVPTGHGTNTFVVNPQNFGAQTLPQVAHQMQGQFVANPNPGWTGQCATGAQFLTGQRVNGQLHDAPSTSTWTQGRGVDAQTRPGTMASSGWDANGHYPNRPTNNHTVVIMSVDSHGNVQVLEQNVHPTQNQQGAYQVRWITPAQASAFHEVESRQAHGGATTSQVSRTRDLPPPPPPTQH